MSDDSPTVLTELREHALWITLNRPSRRNALSPEMVCRLADAWRRADDDERVRVVVLTATGPVFSAGADLRRLVPLLHGERPPEDTWDERVLSESNLAADAFLRRTAPAKPTIAAVEGLATGGGLELVLATTLRVVSKDAQFGLAEVQRGLIPGGGGVARLLRQVPSTWALELLLTGEPVGAARAAEIGLVNQIVPGGQAAARAATYADRIARNGPLAVRQILRIAEAADAAELQRLFALEDDAFGVVTATADAAEGAHAFLEKREPRFTGR